MPCIVRPSRGLQHGGHRSEGEELKGTPRGQKSWRGGLAAGWGVLCQRVPKDSSGLGPYIPRPCCQLVITV